MPLDPFAGDPNDPASFIEDDDTDMQQPLSMEQRASLMEDLRWLGEFKKHIAPRGYRGIFFFCEDCRENHFYDWDILVDHYRAMLNGELSPVHEPGVGVRPEEYLPWDYCLGFVDGIHSR
ncbi:DUF5319 domain-containing protein [uncultured Corynebacterium sp.]|uniref:DUF5319 domain-containing protein n=1 Tax=uncultured Corynebacterium sp. TaxID=159447 RepID=UPI002616665E|nr:DUF5319 domain-containing protein [uncultured Corynebacterium sp.]